MIYTGYIAKWRSYPDDEVKVRVARPHVLSPSKELLHDWKEGNMSWTDYENRFSEEIASNPDAVNEIIRLAKLSRTQNIRLICYEKDWGHCHRRLLFWMLALIRNIPSIKSQQLRTDK